MKMQLPNGAKINLDENITLEEKKQVVKDLTEEFEPIIRLNWNSNNVKFFLDNLANYLVWHKEDEEKNMQDKEILSVRRIEEMSGKRKSKSIPFTSLSQQQKEVLFGEGGQE
jgi:predicted NUDIX family phosphoesterase